MENSIKNINNNKNNMPNQKQKKQEEIRDTSGDTKVFQVIRREDIEREKKRQAIENSKKAIQGEGINVPNKKNSGNKDFANQKRTTKNNKGVNGENPKINNPTNKDVVNPNKVRNQILANNKITIEKCRMNKHAH